MHRCEECGSDVQEGLSSEGLCPACLLWLGLGSDRTPEDYSTAARSAAFRVPWSDAAASLSAGQNFGTYRVERLLGSEPA